MAPDYKECWSTVFSICILISWAYPLNELTKPLCSTTCGPFPPECIHNYLPTPSLDIHNSNNSVASLHFGGAPYTADAQQRYDAQNAGYAFPVNHCHRCDTGCLWMPHKNLMQHAKTAQLHWSDWKLNKSVLAEIAFLTWFKHQSFVFAHCLCLLMMMYMMTACVDLTIISAFGVWSLGASQPPSRKSTPCTCFFPPCYRPFLKVLYIAGLCVCLNSGDVFWCPTPCEEAARPNRCSKLRKPRRELQQPFFLRSFDPTKAIHTWKTIGDGNCYWRAIAKTLPCKWYSLKRKVLRSVISDPYTSARDRLAAKILAKPKQWGNADAIRFTAKYLQRTIFVAHNGGVGVFTSEQNGLPPIFVALTNHHFETVPAHEGLRYLATCDPQSPIPIAAMQCGSRAIFNPCRTTPRTSIPGCTKPHRELASRLVIRRASVSAKRIGEGLPPRNLELICQSDASSSQKHDARCRKKKLPQTPQTTASGTAIKLHRTFPFIYIATMMCLQAMGHSESQYSNIVDFCGSRFPDREPSDTSESLLGYKHLRLKATTHWSQSGLPNLSGRGQHLQPWVGNGVETTYFPEGPLNCNECEFRFGAGLPPPHSLWSIYHHWDSPSLTPSHGCFDLSGGWVFSTCLVYNKWSCNFENMQHARCKTNDCPCTSQTQVDKQSHNRLHAPHHLASYTPGDASYLPNSRFEFRLPSAPWFDDVSLQGGLLFSVAVQGAIDMQIHLDAGPRTCSKPADGFFPNADPKAFCLHGGHVDDALGGISPKQSHAPSHDIPVHPDFNNSPNFIPPAQDDSMLCLPAATTPDPASPPFWDAFSPINKIDDGPWDPEEFSDTMDIFLAIQNPPFDQPYSPIADTIIDSSSFRDYVPSLDDADNDGVDNYSDAAANATTKEWTTYPSQCSLQNPMKRRKVMQSSSSLDHLIDMEPQDEVHYLTTSSVASSYVGSLLDFMQQHGPYRGWEFDHYEVDPEEHGIQLPLIYIPSSPLEPSEAYSICSENQHRNVQQELCSGEAQKQCNTGRFSGGGKAKDNAEAITEADISRQTQRTKDLPHGLVSKQLRMMLKADIKFFRKIQRTANEEHLTTCILAEAKRLGLQATPFVAAPRATEKQNKPTGKGKGKNHEQVNNPVATPGGKGKGKNEPLSRTGKLQQNPAKGSSKGNMVQNSDGGNSTAAKSKGKVKAEVPMQITFEIVPDGWNVLPQQEFDGSKGGIYAIEGEDDAKKLAEAAAHCPFPVGILAPKPIEVGIGAPRPLHVEFFQCKGNQKQVVTLHTYLHQLTQHEVTYAKNARAVQISKPMVARTQVVYVRFTDQGASAQTRSDLQDKKLFQARAWVQTLINTSKPIQIHDVWNFQEQGISNGIRYYTISIRVPSESVPEILRASMPGKVQTNVPAHLREELSHVWLKTANGPMDDDQVKATVANCPVPHLGCFQLRGTWALRVQAAKLAELKQHLGKNHAPAYFVHGAAADMDERDILETCRQIGWKVTTSSEHCRWKRGGPVWLVRAETPPNITAFPLNYGYERLQIQVVQAAKPIGKSAPMTAQVLQPPTFSSWKAQMRSIAAPNSAKPTFKEVLQHAGPPAKKPKLLVSLMTSPLPSPVPPAQADASRPNTSSATAGDSAATDREKTLESQLATMQQANFTQQQQIAQLMEQINKLTNQLQILTNAQAVQVALPPENDDDIMEGGGGDS